MLTDGNILVVATEQELLAGRGRGHCTGEPSPLLKQRVIWAEVLASKGEEVRMFILASKSQKVK